MMQLGMLRKTLLALLLALAVLGAANAAEQARSPYRIGVGDVLEVVVWKNPDVSRKVWVRPDGRITLPLAGELAAEGLTTEELTQVVTTKLKEYLTEPVVTVSLETVNSAVAARPIASAPDSTQEGGTRRAEPTAYRIGVEDVLEVNVWKNPDISRQVWVRPDGRIALPLVGEVLAQGLTTQELAAEVEGRLKRYFADPAVSVGLVEVNSYTVYVMGLVRTPAAVKLRSPRTFLQVLAMAGGFQEFADTGNIVLLRTVSGQQKRTVVDAKKIVSKGTEADFLLQPGDVILVP